MAGLRETMLKLHKKRPGAKGEASTSSALPPGQFVRAIAATDKAIDALVYELYGLTDKEIAMVETAGQG